MSRVYMGPPDTLRTRPLGRSLPILVAMASALSSSDFPFDKLLHVSMFSLCAALFVRGWTTYAERW
ncbi:MAG: hypothetical protein O2971_15055 [Proteobacteria bacterium]|nr:hypothetical protein [Pseudomonadota bacterium]